MTRPTTMRALRLERFGKPAELAAVDAPVPTPAAGEVLVEVRAAAVSPSDVKNVSGLMARRTKLPRVVGRDFAGVVVDGPPHLVGREVWGTGGEFGYGRDGAHAQYLTAPADAVRVKPAALSMAEAAAAGTNFITAWAGLADAAGLKAGETVVVLGATGGVGSAAVQLAKWMGAQVVGTVRRDFPADAADNLRPHVVVNTEREDVKAVVMELTGGAGADVVYDTVAGPFFELGLSLLRIKGRQLEISATGDHRVSFDLLEFYRHELRLFGVDSLHLSGAECAKILGDLAPAFDAGALTPPPLGPSFPLDAAADAYAAVQKGGTAGKVMLLPNGG